jgi:hypothetical protein
VRALEELREVEVRALIEPAHRGFRDLPGPIVGSCRFLYVIGNTN